MIYLYNTRNFLWISLSHTQSHGLRANLGCGVKQPGKRDLFVWPIALFKDLCGLGRKMSSIQWNTSGKAFFFPATYKIYRKGPVKVSLGMPSNYRRIYHSWIYRLQGMLLDPFSEAVWISSDKPRSTSALLSDSLTLVLTGRSLLALRSTSI